MFPDAYIQEVKLRLNSTTSFTLAKGSVCIVSDHVKGEDYISWLRRPTLDNYYKLNVFFFVSIASIF